MKFTRSNVIAFAEAGLSLAAILLLFAPAFILTDIFGGAKSTASGFDAWLGSADVKYSFCGVLLLLFLIILVSAPLIKAYFADKKIKTYLTYAIIALSLSCAVFFFCGATRLMINMTDLEWEICKGNISLGTGAVIGGILMIIVAVSSLFDEFILKQ